jgi:hypothetical protein
LSFEIQRARLDGFGYLDLARSRGRFGPSWVFEGFL